MFYKYIVIAKKVFQDSDEVHVHEFFVHDEALDCYLEYELTDLFDVCMYRCLRQSYVSL